MLVKSLAACREIVAIDRTVLRELLHPDRDPAGLRYSLAHAKLPPESWSLLHALRTSEVYYILTGRATMEIDGERRELEAGDGVYIPPGGRQRIFARGPQRLEFLCIVDPAWRAEDEERLETRNEK
jgi:mannose-6-phosphate isomerase-like protein (cupin superfamily)